jgi:hypothetical protein
VRTCPLRRPSPSLLPYSLPRPACHHLFVVVIGGDGSGCWVVGRGAWCWWCIMVVVGWVVWVEQNERGSSLGDMAHHMMQVGTCCSDRHDFTWAGGSAVKHALLQAQEVGCLNLWKNKCFLPQIKLNCIPSGVLLDNMWSPSRLLRDWIRSPGKVSILMDSIRILSGGYLESTRIH